MFQSEPYTRTSILLTSRHNLLFVNGVNWVGIKRIIFLLCYRELCTLKHVFCWITVDELILENVFEILIPPQVAGVGFVALIGDLTFA